MSIDADRVRRDYSIVPFLTEPKPMIRVRDGQWKVRCSFHADRTPSMLVGKGARGWGYFCYGCGARGDVIRYVMETRGVGFLDAVRAITGGDVPAPVGRELPARKDHERIPLRAGAPRGRIVATYDYCDEVGELLYQAVRLEPKSFYQRRPHPSGHGWVNSIQGVRRVLYRLPELLAADPRRPVYVLEGEKDVDAWRATGRIATCNPCGAGKWRPEYTDALLGRVVTVIPDNDGPGHTPGGPGLKHAEQIVAALAGGAFVTLRTLPEGVKDVSDWLARGQHQPEPRKAA